MNNQHSPRVVLVTGAGRGIGEAIAMAFARAGDNLVLVSRTFPELVRVAKQACAYGVEALALGANVANYYEVRHAVKVAIARFGHIDVLVNNAGICGPVGPLADNNPCEWVDTILNNLAGTAFCMQAVLPYMIQRRQGIIINISGGGAVRPRPCFSSYAASKAAVVRLTETVAAEVLQYNIRINAIAPGIVNTRMLEPILAAGKKAGPEFTSARQQQLCGGHSAKDAAALALFLASPAASSITGRLISAVWDEWHSIADVLRGEPGSSICTLRRIDGREFLEQARPRAVSAPQSAPSIKSGREFGLPTGSRSIGP